MRPDASSSRAFISTTSRWSSSESVFSTLIDEHLSDSREGLNKKFPLADLLRQSVYSRLAGYEDLNDAARCRPIRPFA